MSKNVVRLIALAITGATIVGLWFAGAGLLSFLAFFLMSNVD